MLTRFTVGNFLSFDKNQTLSLVANTVRNHKNRLFTTSDLKIVKFGAIFGANAAGKSNFIKAINFARYLTKKGTKIIRDKSFFKLNPMNIGKTSHFEFGICIDGSVYYYGFEVLISEKKIIEEWLLKENSNREIFSRNSITGKFYFDKSWLMGSEQVRMQIYINDFISVQDVTFLSYMNSNKNDLYDKNPDLDILRKIYDWIYNLDITFPDDVVTGYDCFTLESIERLLDTIKFFNTGITDIRKNKITKESALENLPNKVKDFIEERIIWFTEINCSNKDGCRKRGFSMSPNGRLVFVTFEKSEPVFTEITFVHDNINSIEFSLGEESDGTKRLLDLMSVLLNKNENSVFIIDEIDRSLHPQLTLKFVELFLQVLTEKNIQLLITTHETRLLNLDLLRQDEIFMVEKSLAGSSIIYPFDNFKERFDAKIEERYLNGKYGAIPFFDHEIPFL